MKCLKRRKSVRHFARIAKTMEGQTEPRIVKGRIYETDGETGAVRPVPRARAQALVEQKVREECERWVYAAVDEATTMVEQLRGELPEGYAVGVLQASLMRWPGPFWLERWRKGALEAARSEVHREIMRKVYEENTPSETASPAPVPA